MQNVKITKKEKILTIEIDLSQEQGLSKTGKTLIIATTQGNIEVEPGIYLGVNCYKKR